MSQNKNFRLVSIGHFWLYQVALSDFEVFLLISTENLLPTEHSASFHSMRTYLQVQAWLGRELSPEDWGFQLIHGQCRPIRMVEAPAPIELLKIIRCNCSQNCSTKVCTCKKFNLFCTVACGQCRGLSCCNREPSEDSDVSLLQHDL